MSQRRVPGRLRFGAHLSRGRDSLEVIGGSLVGQAVVVVSGILVARSLSVELRGQLALIALLPLILSQLGGLGIQTSLTYHVAEKRLSAVHQVASMRSVLSVQLLVMVAVNALLVLVIFGGARSEVLEAGLVSLFALPAMFIQQLVLAGLQGEMRFRAVITQRIAPLVLYATAIVFLFVTNQAGIVTITCAYTGAYALSAIYGIYRLLTWHRSDPTRSDNVESPQTVYAFGVRGFLGAVFPVEAFSVDQLYVGLALSPAALGLYVVAAAFMSLPRLVGQAVAIIAYPRVAGEREVRARWRASRRYVLSTLLLCGGIAGVLILSVHPLIVFFFGRAYEGGAEVSQILLIAAWLQSVRWVLAATARGANLPSAGTQAEVITWVVLVPALLLLGSTPSGVAASMVIAYAISLTLLAVRTLVGARRQMRC